MLKKIIAISLAAVLLSVTAYAADELTNSVITPVFQVPYSGDSEYPVYLDPGESVYFETDDLSKSATYGVNLSYARDPSEVGTRIISFDFLIETNITSYSSSQILPYVTGYLNYDTSKESEISLVTSYNGIYAIRSVDSSFPLHGYITSNTSRLDSGTVFNVHVILTTDISTFTNLFLEFDLYDLDNTGGEYTLTLTSPVHVFIEDTSLEDFQDSVTDSLGNVNSNLQGVQSGLNNVVSSLTSGNQDVVTSLEAVKDAIDQFKEDYPEMTQQATQGALESFFNKLKQEAVDAGNETVQAIQEQLNIDISGIQQSTEALYSAVSTHDSNPTLQLKAGTVSIAGQSFTFWETQDITFDEVLNNQWIQLLLIPFRFLIIFGFSKYLLSVVKRVESLVTMNGGD